MSAYHFDFEDSPVLTVELDAVNRNIHRLQKLADANGVKVRPHTKTHKSVYFAKQQLEAGASGITVAKLGEAEIMAKAGMKDILIAYPILGAHKLKRLREVMRHSEVIVSLDSLPVAEGLSELGEAMGRKIRIYLEIDTGLHRTGRLSGQETARFAKSLQALPGISIAGIMSHGGQCYGNKSYEELRRIAVAEAELMSECKSLLEQAGIPIKEVSVGASPTSPFLEDMKGITEIRPGTYIFNDYNQLYLSSAKEEDCAVRIYSTVISKPAADRIVIDAGSKTLTSDAHVTGKGYGYIVSHPEFQIVRLSEEHGVITIPPEADVKIGDTLCIIPNHVCPVVNLADEMIGVRNGRPVQTIPIEARGKNR